MNGFTSGGLPLGSQLTKPPYPKTESCTSFISDLSAQRVPGRYFVWSCNFVDLCLSKWQCRLEVPVRWVIDYTPDVNTLLKSGAAQFSRIEDAVAELIDNSIQVRE